MAIRLVVLLALVSFARGGAPRPPSCEEPDADVLILGAGVSGITAAKTLHKNGVTNFLILEQGSRIGGRAQSTEFAGTTINFGPELITHVDTSVPEERQNPIFRLMRRCGVQYRELGPFLQFASRPAIYDSSGSNLTSNPEFRGTVIAYIRAAAGATNLAEQLNEEDPEGERDISAQVALRIFGWDPRSPMEEFVEWLFVDTARSGEPADSISLRSEYRPVSDFDFGDNSGVLFVTDRRGFIHAVDCLADEFLSDNDTRLRLNTAVVGIRHTPDCVCVDVEGGSEFCAPFALITFSIGVLQSDIVQFSPPLPFDRVFDINLLHMANYLKIWIAFNETFWPDRTIVIGHIDPVNGREYYPFFWAFNNILPDRPSILQAILTGDIAFRVANQDIELTKQQIMGVLRNIYGPDIPDAVDIIKDNHITNSYIRGSWSQPLVGGTPPVYDRLVEPIGRLYFAGEHTNLRYRRLALGAYFSGEDAGNLITREIMASRELRVQFVNDTPLVEGNRVVAEFTLSRPAASVMCVLSRQPRQNCASGRVEFSGLAPGGYTLRVEASNGRADRTVERRRIYISSEESECAVHLINSGVSVRGSSATAEFAGTGEPSSFLCSLDNQSYSQCSSPLELTGLSEGDHRVKIRPEGCARGVLLAVEFDVEP